MTAGIDLCLALLAHDHGEDMALKAARELVVERRRPGGGQSQFSPLLEMQRPDGRFSALLDTLRRDLRQDCRVEAPCLGCMSPRHFARCFLRKPGPPPPRPWSACAQAAQALLEGGNPSVRVWPGLRIWQHRAHAALVHAPAGAAACGVQGPQSYTTLRAPARRPRAPATPG